MPLTFDYGDYRTNGWYIMRDEADLMPWGTDDWGVYIYTDDNHRTLAVCCARDDAAARAFAASEGGPGIYCLIAKVEHIENDSDLSIPDAFLSGLADIDLDPEPSLHIVGFLVRPRYDMDVADADTTKSMLAEVEEELKEHGMPPLGEWVSWWKGNGYYLPSEDEALCYDVCDALLTVSSKHPNAFMTIFTPGMPFELYQNDDIEDPSEWLEQECPGVFERFES